MQKRNKTNKKKKKKNQLRRNRIPLIVADFMTLFRHLAAQIELREQRIEYRPYRIRNRPANHSAVTSGTSVRTCEYHMEDLLIILYKGRYVTLGVGITQSV
jgi:hypothetical protein